MKTLVFVEKTKALEKICCAAYKMGSVEALQVGNIDDNQELNTGFVDKTWIIDAHKQVMVEEYSESIAALLNQEKPDVFLLESSKRCKLIAGRIAMMLGCSVSNDVQEIGTDGVVKRMVYGGAAIRKEKGNGQTSIILVSPSVLEDPIESVPGTGKTECFEFIEPKIRVNVLSTSVRPKSSVDLTAAKRVIGVGRGLACEEDLAMVYQFAQSISAEVGCTRPIAEGEKWMPKETYIGVSGLMLVPDIYVAFGVSGQIQHMVGVNQSKVVIAVNKDKNAMIFEQADYGIVADLYKVLPALNNYWK